MNVKLNTSKSAETRIARKVASTHVAAAVLAIDFLLRSHFNRISQGGTWHITIHRWESKMKWLYDHSMDWFKGKFTGNHGFYHQI